jgi:hypothetical protein
MMEIIMLSMFFIFACDPETPKTEDTATTNAICNEVVPVTCEDALYLDLGLQDTVSDGEVSTVVDGEDFVTLIDATGGGYQSAATNPWVYLKFTDNGAEKVEISDEEALESLDWDMSLRRFILRLNGGASGPSCVGSAVFIDDTYTSLSDVPNGVMYVEDDFYTPDCSLINDSSGLPDNPQTVMGPWWEYPGCVATTGYPFIIQQANGRLVKLVVETYYTEDQELCNSTGTPGSGGANITIRWTFLQ